MPTDLKKRIFDAVASLVLSALLLFPIASKFAHDFFEGHVHEICASELDGEIHFHAADGTCDFHAVYLFPFDYTEPAIQSYILPGVQRYTEAIPETVYAVYTPLNFVRGPPA